MLPHIHHSPGVQDRFYWLIYLDSALFLYASNNEIKVTHSLVLDHKDHPEKGVQSLLSDFYNNIELPKPEKIDLCFHNTIFHKSNDGPLECFMNHRSGFLFYHQTFFDVPVQSEHIAPRLVRLMKEWLEPRPDVNLWFHLRHEILYVLFSPDGHEAAASAYEVRKALDVHYYILFHLKTLRPVLGGEISKMTVSGDLLEMEGLYNFIETNSPGTELVSLSALLLFPGKMDHHYAAFLPEVNF